MIKSIFCFIKNWSDVFLIGVGLFAYFIYRFQKADKIRNAATELKEQIVEIENSIERLKELLLGVNSVQMYKLGPILTESLWKKNRSILSSHLEEEDRRLIQNFYISAERIERARGDIVKCLIDAWYHKSNIEQEHIYNHIQDIRPESENSEARLDLFMKDGRIFSPKICEETLNEANGFNLLSGTTTYKELVKLSKKKI